MSDSSANGCRILRWLRKAVLVLVGLAILLAYVGAAYQSIGTLRDAQRFPQRGRTIRAGPLKMNMDCAGTGSPTVILEQGGGMPALGWTKVQPQIAKFTRVCSYDRAGYGWSEPGPMPRTIPRLANEFKALLDASGEKGPCDGTGIAGRSYRAPLYGALSEGCCRRDFGGCEPRGSAETRAERSAT